MKKYIVFVLAMLVLVAPAWATTVTITAEQVGDTNEVEIKYVTDANRPRAFALDITVTDGDIVDCIPFLVGECNDVLQGYGIFPGTFGAVITVLPDGTVEDWGVAGYTPVAPQSDLPGDTQPGLDSNGITIEMGSLYEDSNYPADSGTLCTIRLSALPRKWGSSGDTYVSIALNVSRGGIVMEDVNETPTLNLAINVPIRTHKACTYYDSEAYGLGSSDPNFSHFLDGDCVGGPGTGFEPDGKVDAKDVNLVIKAANWGMFTTVNGGTADECADIAGGPGTDFKPDGKVDAKDVNMIIKAANWNCPTSGGCTW